MFNDCPPPTNDRLGDQLRQEAESARPAFSPQLHARIRQALDRERSAPTQPAPWRRRARRGLVAGAAALAAAIAVAVWLAGQSPTSPPPPTETADDFVAVLAQGRQLPQHLSGLLDTALADGRWAYLDQDMQTAINALVQTLPTEVPIAGLYQKLADSSAGRE